jgi:lipopolysaccharide transport system permease protein
MPQIFNILNPVWYAPSIRATCGILYKHRLLLWEMSKLELRERYVGQVLGIFWAVVMPILTMIVYLFIFAFVFKARMPDAQGIANIGWGGSYALYLLSGLIPWLSLQDIMSRSVTAVSGNARLVKQVVFPLEILPLKLFYPSLINLMITLSIFLTYGVLMHGLPSPFIVCLPIAILAQFILATGIAFLFSAAGVYLRDMKDIVGFFCFVMVFIMPVFFAPGMLPERIYNMLLLNPFSHMILVYRDILFYGAVTAPLSWFIFPAFALAVCCLGCRAFYTVKPLFGNVL